MMTSISGVQQWNVPTEKYNSILALSQRAAEVIVRQAPIADAHESLQFVFQEAIKLHNSPKLNSSTTTPPGVVPEMLELLKNNWSELACERKKFSSLIKEHPHWWLRFMTEFPMGEYASMAYHVLKEEKLLHGNVFEIGSGIGNTARLVENDLKTHNYLRSDLNIKLLKEANLSSKYTYYDFNKPSSYKQMDTIFAVNALHCASDKLQTFRYLKDSLAINGTLLLAEGTPYPTKNNPWALTFFCGLWDGWWDQGGFISREEWSHYLLEAGFKNIRHIKMSCGDADLGGVIWAENSP